MPGAAGRRLAKNGGRVTRGLGRIVMAVGVLLAVCAPATAQAARPVPSLTPAATLRLWRTEVARARIAVHAPLAGSCRPSRVVVYAQTDWLRVATELAANSSPCAQYYVSVPPLAADKSQPRSGQAAQIRALGANFHALDEISYAGWSSWVSAGSGSWFAAGQTARQRMSAAGFDVTAGDGWMLNELSSAVRKGTGTARADALAFMHGLAADGVKGVVATAGLSQSTPDLTLYKVNLQDWLEDGAFWTEVAGYVGDWAQENYGDVRDYAVGGSTPADRAAAIGQYLGHESALAVAAPSVGAPARALLSATYLPLGNGAWAWSSAYGWTAVPVETMEDFVSGQVYADRSLGASTGAAADRIGFAWAPSNTLGLSSTDFNNETKAVLDRIAAAVHDTDAGAEPAGAAACLPSWCATALADAAFTGSWQSFATWSPQLPVITSAPLSTTTGTSVGPGVVQLETLGLPDNAAWGRTVTLTSTSSSGEFATDPAGPWAPSLALSIGVGMSTASFFYVDQQAGSPVITAALDDGSTSSQQESIGIPQPPPSPPGPPPPMTQPISMPPAGVTTTTPVAPPAAPRKPAAVGVAHIASVKTRRLHGHVVVSVRARAGARAAAHVAVLIRVHRASTTIALATRTTDADGVATWRSPRILRPGRYTATAAVRR
jgi:hypothetical protein